MKTLGDILNNVDLSKGIDEKKEEFADSDYKLINHLFRVLTAIFPAFKQAWPTESEFEMSKREWIKAFKQANLTHTEDMKRGVDKYRLLTTPFVPSPGQFIAMCKENIYPIPMTVSIESITNLNSETQRSELQKIKSMLGIRK